MKTKLHGGLSARALILGLIACVFITASSLFVALKLGALPWPIVFASILSYLVLKLLGNTSLSEVNVAHTAMSAGAMVAGGIAFTIPAIWIMNPQAQISWYSLAASVFIGLIIGLAFSYLLRRQFIEESELVYPMGEAAAQTLQSSEAGGKELGLLSGSLSFSALFTVLRDALGIIPQTLFSKLSFLGVPLSLYFSPMLVSVGYLLGPLASIALFIGALFGSFAMLGLAVQFGILELAQATLLKNSLGIGLMIGSGLGVLLKAALGLIKRVQRSKGMQALPSKQSGKTRMKKALVTLIICLTVAILSSFLFHLPFLASLIFIALCGLSCIMALQSVGQTAIDPMEVFAVVVVLLIQALWSIQSFEAVLLCCIVAVACGLAGDVMSDFKAGHILHTKAHDQFIAECAGAFVGAIVALAAFYALVHSYGTDIFGPDKQFIAVQAQIVASTLNGSLDFIAMLVGIILALILFLANIPAIMLGLGVYLPLSLSLMVCFGALLRQIVQKVLKLDEDNKQGTIIASGLLGGEAIVGVILAFLASFGFLLG
ncbi:MAG: OPT/YSL family transporter [Coriobacteriia bacterium]|nr:OPT/YSL family transporter [Coriobacteriia bacterium]